MAKSDLKAQCERDGKLPLVLGAKQSGIPIVLDMTTVTGVCLAPDEIGHLPATFGADVIRSRISGQSGAGLYSVLPGSPAAKAGLRASDFIVEFRGQQIMRADDLQAAIASTTAGEEATVKFRRNRDELIAKIQF
jgi:S1-C subfamily serine protease